MFRYSNYFSSIIFLCYQLFLKGTYNTLGHAKIRLGIKGITYIMKTKIGRALLSPKLK